MSLHYHCVRCGSKVELGQKFCGVCGAALEKSFGYRCAVHAALQGDPEGFTYLYESTCTDSLLVARKYLNSDHEAEEVVQDAYKKAFGRLGALQNPGEFPAWMEGIVADTASERSKKKQPLFFAQLKGEKEAGEEYLRNRADRNIKNQQKDQNIQKGYRPEARDTQKQYHSEVKNTQNNYHPEARNTQRGHQPNGQYTREMTAAPAGSTKGGFFHTLGGRIAIIAGCVVIGGGLIGGGIALFNNHKNNPSSGTQVQTQESDKGDAAAIEIAEGDHIRFGSYEQDLNEDNKKEEIEWRVLSVDDDQVLLISDKILYITNFSKAIMGAGPLEKPSEAYPDWASSGIRKWLNEVFLKDLFSDEEQKLLVPRKTTGSSPDIAGEDPAQTDKVFFLSMEEAEAYFASDQERRALATDYAWKQYYDLMQVRLQSPMLPPPEIIAEFGMPFEDFLSSHRTESAAWWLRTYSVYNLENSPHRAAYFSFVRIQGDVYGQEVVLGTDGERSGIGIRPSICIKKDAIDKDMVVNREGAETESSIQ